MRKIAVLTGSRGDYGVYSSVLDAIDVHPDLEYELIVTCMHLENEFGYTIREIEKDKRKIGAKVSMLKYGDGLGAMAKNTGTAIVGITQALEQIKPDIVLVLGDRGEQLAAAIAAAHLNIAVAHLHGGEVSGTIDESIRHAITKFAHIHLAPTHKSKERILKLGERYDSVFVVGAPGVDSVKRKAKLSREQIAGHFSFDEKKPIVLAVQHPVTTEFNSAKDNMSAVADALVELDEQAVFIYSNSDAGYGAMMDELTEKIKAAGENIKMFKSLPHDIYLGMLESVDVMIGNSSSGVIEAPSCQTPYVLVGSRQQGREKAQSIIEVDYDKDKIIEAAHKAISDKAFKQLVNDCPKPYDPFNDDKAGERTAQILATFEITPEIIQKRITY
jgi:UDP-N-acetylglucosamine 2-epimerase (non-hydrolysing)/GDP/UDP-N,N'-diacetylbacillosamine 2-epimerase (hydrolysing)